MSEPEPPSFCCCFNGQKALVFISFVSIVGCIVSGYLNPQLELLTSYIISILIEFLVLFSVSSMKHGPLKYTYWILSFVLFLNLISLFIVPIYVSVEFTAGFTENSIIGRLTRDSWPSTLSVNVRKSFGLYFGYGLLGVFLLNILFSAYRISIILQLMDIGKYRKDNQVKVSVA